MGARYEAIPFNIWSLLKFPLLVKDRRHKPFLLTSLPRPRRGFTTWPARPPSVTIPGGVKFLETRLGNTYALAKVFEYIPIIACNWDRAFVWNW